MRVMGRLLLMFSKYEIGRGTIMFIIGWAGLVAFGINLIHISSKVACVPADIVRLSLKDIEFHIPTELQPLLSPNEAVRTEDYYVNGRRTTRYCQSEQNSDVAVDWIGFRTEDLNRWVAANRTFVQLENTTSFSISRTAGAPPPLPQGSEIIAEGLFRRVVGSDSNLFVSSAPLLFGSHVTAACYLSSVEGGRSLCQITGWLPDSSLLRVGFIDTMPTVQWLSKLKAVELFISSLNSQR